MASSKIESQKPRSPIFVIFSSGSNSIDQLEDRLGARPQPLNDGWLYGFERAFFGCSKRWEKSTATLIPGKKVAGLFIKFKFVDKQDVNSLYQVQTSNGWETCNFDRLMKAEAVDIGKYQLRQISNYTSVPLFAFVHCSDYSDLSFRQPSDDYIKAIAKMLQDRRRVLGQALWNPYYIDVRGIEHIPNLPVRAVVTASLNNVQWKRKQASCCVSL
uniref:Uncharacterized protein n=1 Tax=Marseillevirus LCMAC101 TaxID=2506602 RepID=A0A481YRY2_9VIRU|nr:MAG: hypothetical protein LCMAC101_05430 [Marseillevirus LCMAC101]